MKRFRFIVTLLFVAVMCLACSAAWGAGAGYAIPIDNVHFPDGNFRKYVMTQYGRGYDTLDTNNLNNCTFVKPSDPYSTSLTREEYQAIFTVKGVEILTYLREFALSNAQLSYIDFSKNTKLESVTCSNNKLVKLNLENTSELKRLYCQDNMLSELDLSDSEELEQLYCQNNRLTSLKIPKSAKLFQLNCEGNNITNMDVDLSNSVGSMFELSFSYPLEDTLEFDLAELKRLFNLSVTVSDFYASINNTSGLIDGTLSSNGVISFPASLSLAQLKYIALKVSEANGKTLSSQLSVRIYPAETQSSENPPVITTESLPYPVLNKSYSQTLKFSGTTPITCSIKSGALPDGLTLSDSGTISGTPTAKGTYSFVVEAKNSAGAFTMPYAVVVSQYDPVEYYPEFFTDTSLPEAVKGEPYLASIDVVGLPWIYSAISYKSLPSGLQLSSYRDGTITISGTPAEAGSFYFAIKATNVVQGEATQYFNLYVGMPVVKPTPPSIATVYLRQGTQGAAYSSFLSATGTQPITWSLLSGRLPNGLALSAYGTAGLISGIPTESGTFTLTLQAQNEGGIDQRTYTLIIDAPPVVVPAEKEPAKITTEEPLPATSGAPYECQLQASGTPPFTWTLVKGKMPAGLTMSSSGLISGTPPKKGKAKLKLTVSNDKGSDTKDLTLMIYDLPQLTTNTLKGAIMGKKYSLSLKKKGTGPFTWSISGTLPNGLSLDASKGKITGTPADNGTSTVIITLSNPVGSVSKVYSLDVSVIPPTFAKKKLKDATYGKAYKETIKLKGSVPISLLIYDALPEGLTFNSQDNTITGIPTQTCVEWPVSFLAFNRGGQVETTYSLTVKPTAPKFTTKSLPGGMIYNGYLTEITATGTTPISFWAEGLPSGMWMEENYIVGAPEEYGTFKVILHAINELNKEVKKNYKLIVQAPPEFDENQSEELAAGYKGEAYETEIMVTGSKTLKLKVTSGKLPSGIKLNSSKGVLKGKPKDTGTFDFTITASNPVGSASKTFTLTIYGDTASARQTASPQDNLAATEPEGSVSVPEDSTGNPEGAEYVVVAELPEVSADVSGMYDFSVTLSDDAKAGEKLIWLANSSEPGEDDNIAEFSDEDGAEIDAVPENRKVNVSAWLRQGVIYHPAIAVKR